VYSPVPSGNSRSQVKLPMLKPCTLTCACFHLLLKFLPLAFQWQIGGSKVIRHLQIVPRVNTSPSWNTIQDVCLSPNLPG
jgi:hypothetical protein